MIYEKDIDIQVTKCRNADVKVHMGMIYVPICIGYIGTGIVIYKLIYMQESGPNVHKIRSPKAGQLIDGPRKGPTSVPDFILCNL